MPATTPTSWIKAAEPYALLLIATLSFGGNVVAGQMAKGEISPLLLTFLRWVTVASFLLAFNGQRLLAAWPLLRPRLGLLVAMAVFGFTTFNSLFYVAAYHTTGVNIGILQGTIPALVLVGALIAYRTPVRPLQMLGTLVTMIGVVVVTTGGELARLAALALNPGDLIMLLACLFYSGYAVALKRKPQVPALVFFTVLAVIAAISMAPVAAFEYLSGDTIWPSWKGAFVLLYVAFFPSFLSQVFLIRGVELIGPGRASLFFNFVPVFAALLSVLLLDEVFQLYHAIALVLVLFGVALAESRSRKAGNG